MTKLIVGVDISKATFEVCITCENVKNKKSSQYSNDAKGFDLFVKVLPTNAHVIMEASGPYYLQLAMYLYDHGYAVSVINALSIRHFVRMRMHRSKTDKKDASYIAEYGLSEQANLRFWEPPSRYIIELQQAESLADGLTRQGTQLKNMREAFTSSGFTDTCALSVIKEQIEAIEQQISILETYMVELTELHHADLFERVKSIPGLGKRNVMMLIVITNAFTKFENSKQLVAYVGLDPGVYTSGTSVHGSKRIKKMGMGRMRQLLYLGAMQAKKGNKSCKELYDRLVAKGTQPKKAIIAVAHKLLRQAFAVGTSGNYYQEKPVVKLAN